MNGFNIGVGIITANMGTACYLKQKYAWMTIFFILALLNFIVGFGGIKNDEIKL